MSLNYFLDGYNILHQLPKSAGRGHDRSLQDQRSDLLRFIDIHRLYGSSNNTVTVVFDGQLGVWGQPQTEGIKVVFSSGESADDYIKRAVSRSLHKKNIVVVTNDRDIKLYVRAQGAQVKSVEEFLGRERPRPLPTRKGSAKVSEKTSDSKYISKTLEHKITVEFEQIWLKKPGK